LIYWSGVTLIQSTLSALFKCCSCDVLSSGVVMWSQSSSSVFKKFLEFNLIYSLLSSAVQVVWSCGLKFIFSYFSTLSMLIKFVFYFWWSHDSSDQVMPKHFAQQFGAWWCKACVREWCFAITLVCTFTLPHHHHMTYPQFTGLPWALLKNAVSTATACSFLTCHVFGPYLSLRILSLYFLLYGLVWWILLCGSGVVTMSLANSCLVWEALQKWCSYSIVCQFMICLRSFMLGHCKFKFPVKEESTQEAKSQNQCKNKQLC